MAEMYEVEAILDRKVKGGEQHYLIKWKGYDRKAATWQPASGLQNIPLMIDTFEQQQAQPKKKKIPEIEDYQPHKAPRDNRIITKRKAAPPSVKDKKKNIAQWKVADHDTANRKSILQLREGHSEEQTVLTPKVNKNIAQPPLEDNHLYNAKLKEKLKALNLYKHEEEEKPVVPKVQVLNVTFNSENRSRMLEVQIGNQTELQTVEQVKTSHPRALCDFYQRILNFRP